MNKAAPLLIIAGFAEGLGTALADKYSQQGYQVIALSRKEPSSDVLNFLGDSVHYYAVDLTNSEAVVAVFDEIFKTHGVPSVLIHNVAQLVISPFTKTDIGQFKSTWETICLSAIMCAQMCLPKMEAKGGSMIFTGATASTRGGDKFAAFASAKFALRGLAQSLAREYGPKGINVIHTLLDGLIWGPQTIERFNAPQGSCLLPEHIADVYFNLSRQPSSAWTHEVDLRPAGESF